MAEELVLLLIGGQSDADHIMALLSGAGIPAQATCVSSWRALQSVSAGWDVVVAGGPSQPASPPEIAAGLPGTFTIPVLALAHPPFCAVPDGVPVEWFAPRESSRLVPVLRALWRATVAEGRERQALHRTETLEHQLRQTGRLHALGQMAAGVAHEFNNVLTVIGGFCEQLLPHLRGHDAAERLVHPIRQAGLRGAELSQRLLLFSRHQAPVIGDANVTTVIGEATAMFGPLLGETVSTRVHLDHSLPRVRGHAGHLVEVITNLAVNARDAMPSGGTLTIETRRAAPGDEDGGVGSVALVVSDTGIGMDAETLARACDPFFTTKGPDAGTGLGLSLVRDLVEQSGGTLTLASTVGVGTVVTVTLPGVRPEEETVEEIGLDSATPGGLERVLVVEDDASVRDVVTQFLRGAAYSVLEARDADEAITLVKGDPRVLDLLVTDIVLPGQGGPELAGTLRAFAPQMRTLFISGYPSNSVGGAQSPVFLAKPFSRAAFLQAVRRALSAPRHRDIHAADSPGRLSERERATTEERTRTRSH